MAMKIDDLLSEVERKKLAADLAAMAEQRRRAEVEARDWRLGEGLSGDEARYP